MLLATTGCVAGTGESEAAPSLTATERATLKPASSPTPDATPTERTCEELARIDWREVRSGEWVQYPTGEPVDGGERSGAAGTAHVDSDGRVIGYTVAAGDAPSVIGDRFCTDYISILHFNDYWVRGDGKDIAPGDYLYLVPDPNVTNPNP